MTDYVTEKCGEILGPGHGAYLLFDSKATLQSGRVKIPEHLKGSVFECLIVVRGVPASDKTRYMAVHWRGFHLRHSQLDGFKSSPEACGNAYVTIYEGIAQAPDKIATGNLTLCGKSAIKPDIEFEGEYVSLYFYIDYTVPKTDETTVTTADYQYPEVIFKLDITSFDYDCKTTIIDETMKCEQSKRCIDDSLRCDFHSSLNCASESSPLDKSDRSRSPPANCGQSAQKTTTTSSPPPTVTFKWLPVVAAGCSFILSLIVSWCFWRPGYCLWRCARRRNSRCCIWYRARKNGFRPKADTQKERIPRNAILTRLKDSGFLQVDGFSDGGYSGVSTRTTSPIGLHGFSSRNSTARGSTPTPHMNRKLPVTPCVFSLKCTKIGLNDDASSINNSLPQALNNHSLLKKPRLAICPCLCDSKKSSKQGWASKRITVAPVDVITITEIN